MLAFWSTVTLLLAAALLFVLPPLLRRAPLPSQGAAASADLALVLHRERLVELDQDLRAGRLDPATHAQESADLQRRVLEDLPDDAAPASTAPAGSAAPRRWAMPVLAAAALPALVLALYLPLGQPDAAAPPEAPAAAGGGPGGSHALTPQQMQGLVARLAERLKTQPEDADGWHMLARSYVNFQRYADAVQAYDRAAQLQPANANLLADFADVLAMVNGRNLEGQPLRIINAALEADPQHPKALALAGTAAYNRRDYGNAVAYWQRLLRTQAPGSESYQRVAGSIAEAQAKVDGGAPAAASSGSLRGEVLIAEHLKSRLPAQATLFVFARAVDGPRMPVAIARLPATAGPVAFTLDDRSAMQPGWKLSQQAQVMLGARISASGSATPQAGDLVGALGPVAPGSNGLRLVVNEVQP
jgi:cytochrome c-type biogenesis protein CcmH